MGTDITPWWVQGPEKQLVQFSAHQCVPQNPMLRTRQHLGEDICELVACGDVEGFDNRLLYIMLNRIPLNTKVPRAFVKRLST